MTRTAVDHGKNLGEITYPLGSASRLTGLSADLLRAWERRYNVVVPLRTAAGTRRYRASDLERLRLLKAAVDAGYRIGEVAPLESDELERRLDIGSVRPGDSIESVLAAFERLDDVEAARRIALQLAALGPLRFAREFALPLLESVGKRRESRDLCIASESLASSMLRSQLGAALHPGVASQRSAPIIFATTSGERDELGLLLAALTALGAGGNPLYLGADLPEDDLVRAVEMVQADALALGFSSADGTLRAEESLRTLRADLPDEVELWVSGNTLPMLDLPEGTNSIESLGALEQRVAVLRSRRPRRRLRAARA